MKKFANYPSPVDKSMLISGGASGISAAFVEHFSRQGAKVAFLDLDQKSGESLAFSLAEVAHPPIFIACDVTDLSALASGVAQAGQNNGLISVLMNNAASNNRMRSAPRLTRSSIKTLR